MKWLHRFLLKFKFYRQFTRWAKTYIPPGFTPLPLFTVFQYFYQEYMERSLGNRASSLAYNFMLAIFPGTIFLFTLIPFLPKLLPFIPERDFQEQLISLPSVIMPRQAYLAFQSTIVDIIKNQNGKLLSLGFVTTVYFSTNGVTNLMRAFNKASLIPETRTWWRRRWIALILTVIISISLLIAITIMIASQGVIHFFKRHLASKAAFWIYTLALSKWVIIIFIFFFTVSLLYRYGPAHKHRWKFLNPGSILATGLAILTSLGFTFYINHFASYNKVYGSIGTLIVLMLWLYLNSLIVLIGFELNAAIDLSKRDIKIIKPRYNSFKRAVHPKQPVN